MRAERLYAFFYLTLRPNSGKEQKSLQKESQNRLNTGEKKIRVTLLSPLCVSRNCSLRPFSAHKEFCNGGRTKKRKKKEFVTREKREQQKKRYRFNVKIFKERGARAYTLSSSSNARRKGLFSRFFLEKERRRRARGSVLGFVKREREGDARTRVERKAREEAKRQKNLSETCHHANGTGNV